MSRPAPPLDARSADDIRRQLRERLAVHLPALSDPDSGASAALCGVFARYAELIIERLNRVPDKNRLAFFDLIGASLLPPQAARVPLTFTLARGALEATVPARTQVGTPPAPGQRAPLVFETEHELHVSSARVTAVFARDPAQDAYADLSAVIDAAVATGVSVFSCTRQRDRAMEHVFYLGVDELADEPPAELTLGPNYGIGGDFPPEADKRQVQWEWWDGAQWQLLPGKKYPQANPPPSDYSDNLRRGGTIFLNGNQKFARCTVAGIESTWLRARLLTPINLSAVAREGSVRASQLPTQGQSFSLNAYADRKIALDAGFANQTPLDLSNDVLPFGEKPRFGDVLYLASREAFSTAGTMFYLPVGTSTYSVSPYVAEATFFWEFWDGTAWQSLSSGSPTAQGWPFVAGQYEAFTGGWGFRGSGGGIAFKFPAPPQPTTVNGVHNYWIRARLIGGPVAKSAVTDPVNGTPPSIGPPLLTYQRRLSAYFPDPFRADPAQTADRRLRVLGYNDSTWTDYSAGSRYEPFTPTADRQPTLYFALLPPPGRAALTPRKFGLYLDLAAVRPGTLPDSPAAATAPRLVWEYRSAAGWTRLLVDDGTRAFMQSGLVEFLPPADLVRRRDFDDRDAFWVRVRWDSGDYKFLPRLRRVLTNTVQAVQSVTVSAELLGSSNGLASQRYDAARKPVLAGAQLEVREPELPSATERAAVIALEGADAITPAAGGGAWVRWHEVGDFHGSGPRDRHYVLDHLAGEIIFGDGRSGLIPPRGAGNIRLARYSSGGGEAGNLAAGAITQLKTTVPFVAGVANPFESGGGVGAETLDLLLERAPRAIRHGDRAVTLEDYEDLARLASPEVARSRCVPLLDLREPEPKARVGQLSLIVVPYSKALQPTPSAELIERVREYLDARRLPGVELVVLGAEYVNINVSTEIGIKDLSAAREVELAVRSAIEGFLHPLTGGFDGQGWDFGRHPHRSDLYALLEAVDGVDYVRTLGIEEVSEGRPANTTDRFLVCSGAHRIDLYYGV